MSGIALATACVGLWLGWGIYNINVYRILDTWIEKTMSGFESFALTAKDKKRLVAGDGSQNNTGGENGGTPDPPPKVTPFV